MKKVLFALLLAITFVACEGPAGEMGPKGPMGPQGPIGETTEWHIEKIVVHESDWKLVGKAGDLNTYYIAEKPISNLNQYIYDWGNVNGYIEFSFNNNAARKFNMPYSVHKGEAGTNNDYLWTETYDFDFEVGKVTFYTTYSDFSTNIAAPGTETFYITLTW